MTKRQYARFLAFGALWAAAALGSCASPPRKINNICAVFDQNDGFFNNWHSAAKKAERKYGVPVHVLMATIRKESGFKHDARPPRTYYLGFIPGKRASTAYGYSQALNGTWDNYRRETGSFAARRTNFADAVDFVAWYHKQTADKFGLAPDDAFNLYLAYYSGWGAYGKGAWRSNASLINYARSTASMADDYRGQLQDCR